VLELDPSNMASYNAVKERQDVPIWNAIEAGNFKQALKLVDKRLLKKPTEYLQVRDDNR
jgi:N-terminal acetyltransferase B complex non-catalytic subunit